MKQRNLQDKFMALPRIAELRQDMPQELLLEAYVELRKLGWEMLREISRLQKIVETEHAITSDGVRDRNTAAPA